MVRELAIKEWKLQVNQNSIDEETPARCWLEPYYNKATIEIDPNAHETIGELVENYRHELIHVVLAPLDEFRRLASCGLRQEVEEVFNELYTQCVERIVVRIENMLDLGLELPSKRYVELYRQRQAEQLYKAKEEEV